MLQMVVGVCQKKRQCKFNTNPKTFQGDPCPGLKKYIEVAYKCRPCKYSSYAYIYTHTHTYTYTHIFVRINARTCASRLARLNFAFARVVFLWDIRFLFMRTSSISFRFAVCIRDPTISMKFLARHARQIGQRFAREIPRRDVIWEISTRVDGCENIYYAKTRLLQLFWDRVDWNKMKILKLQHYEFYQIFTRIFNNVNFKRVIYVYKKFNIVYSLELYFLLFCTFCDEFFSNFLQLEIGE